MRPQVRIADGSEDNGFAGMLAELIRQNAEDNPKKGKTLGRIRGRVAIVVEDIKVSVTLLFDESGLTVHDGIVGIPDVTIRADSDDVTKMSLMEMAPAPFPFRGIPDPRGSTTREIFGASRTGRIRMYGALMNLPLVGRLTRVMSVND
ncbi:MAG: SCP2 sterol-binding domain-containing protein [Myxococcales bacterium]|nr:SCP2 sterol-binding domain-containing protein [Myxococcales bacterium]